MFREKCLFCNQLAEYYPKGATDSTYACKCPNCGDFYTTDEFKRFHASSLSDSNKAIISGFIRESFDPGKKVLTITEDNFIDICNSSIVARYLHEKLDKLILYIYRKTTILGETISYSSETDYSVCYARSESEFMELIKVLRDNGYIHANSSQAKLTYAGFQYAEKLILNIPVSDSAFVAMWFSQEMLTTYDTAIKPAIESEECGKFKAFRVDNHEHNNDITDEIIAGIKACRFMVADMTGYRGGVYYEAGFARGLGKPVIYTCRKDWFEGEPSHDGKPVKERIHFDINHMNIIVWENPDDLKQRIINRIRATII